MKFVSINLKMHKPVLSGLCKTTSLLFIIVILSFIASCGKDEVPKSNPDPDPNTEIPSEVIVLNESDVEDYDKFYKPQEHRSLDMLRSDSRWSFVRSRQSEHFVVFWEEGFGSDPNAATVPQSMRVDIDDLLAKAETYFDMNVNKLKFAEIGVGKSNLDIYKMQIYLFYTEEWMAYGAGYDNIIGALWVNPSTCKPVGSTIAHEIGHSFQYQVFCDLKEGSGFRYGFGGNGGNAFWEQCAQWQSYQSYPEQTFGSYNFTVYSNNYFRHICHEWQRYASYWVHYYWADKHGRDIIGRIWREAKEPEDPIQAYMRITGLSVDELNAELYEAATRFVTWDIDAIRSLGSNYIGKHSYKFYQLTDGSYQVAYSHCPGSTGYNVIPLNVPQAGTVVTASFTALSPGSVLADADPGNYTDDGQARVTRKYNSSSITRAGWRYGYVALLQNGQRVYGEMNKKMSENVEFIVPDGCSNLWFVVLGAPTTYTPHPWDEIESNDDQWPYKVRFTNTDILGNISFDGSETPEDVTLTYEVGFPFSSSVYPGKVVALSDADLYKLAKAFVLQPSAITGFMDNKITFYAVESTSQLNANRTANGYGHWFNASGNVCPWGSDGRVFSEFNASEFSFSIGQHPGQCATGDRYTIKQALVYEFAPGNKVQATFVFNISIN